MTEEEWYKRGEEYLADFNNVNNGSLTGNERSAFMYAWELAYFAAKGYSNE